MEQKYLGDSYLGDLEKEINEEKGWWGRNGERIASTFLVGTIVLSWPILLAQTLYLKNAISSMKKETVQLSDMVEDQNNKIIEYNQGLDYLK